MAPLGPLDHRAELAPGGDVAAAGERPAPAQPVAAGAGTADPVGAKQAKVKTSASPRPDLALRLDRPMRQRQPVRHRAVDGPAGRGAGRRDRQRDPERHLAVIFEPAELLRPAGAQQFGGADLVDDVRKQVAVALGLLGQGADFGHHRARPADQLVGARDAEMMDRGCAHSRPSMARGLFQLRSAPETLLPIVIAAKAETG